MRFMTFQDLDRAHFLDFTCNRSFQAAEKDEEVESLLRKADHLATLATSELNSIERDAEPEMSASTIDQKYFELVALADRLSGVSKQLKGTEFN